MNCKRRVWDKDPKFEEDDLVMTSKGKIGFIWDFIRHKQTGAWIYTLNWRNRTFCCYESKLRYFTSRSRFPFVLQYKDNKITMKRKIIDVDYNEYESEYYDDGGSV